MTLVGWIVHNGIWSILVASGVFALPFLAIILQEWLKARSEGAEEGNKGVLSAMRIENRVWVAIVVILFAGIPFIDVDLNTLRFDDSRARQCQIQVPAPTDTGWSQSFITLNNQSAKVPVWWAFMHALSRAVPNIITRAASDIGLAVGSAGFFPAMDVVRQALPMVLSFLKMALVICIPLVIVIGTYDLKSLVTISIVQFALFFVDFWFQLARWIDATILDALYGWGWGWNRPHTNFDPMMGLNNAFNDMLLNFVMAAMFIVMPAFWITALTWAGIHAGGGAQNLVNGSKDAQSAGGKGGGLLTQATKK